MNTYKIVDKIRDYYEDLEEEKKAEIDEITY